MATDPVNVILRAVARVATRRTRQLGRPPDVDELTRSLRVAPDFAPATVSLPGAWRDETPDVWLHRVLASDVWGGVARAAQVHLLAPRDTYWVRAVEVCAPPCLVYRSGRDLTCVDWVGVPGRPLPERRADEHLQLLGLYVVRQWRINPVRTRVSVRLEVIHQASSLERRFHWWHVRPAEDLATWRAKTELGPGPTSYELTV